MASNSPHKKHKTSHNTTSAKLRLMNDYKFFESEDAPDGVSASPQSDDNLFVWNATITGPDDSAFEGEWLFCFFTVCNVCVF